MPSFLQIIGIIKIKRKYGKDLPDIHQYQSSIQYDLPFKDFSHSRGIPAQRYAYDLLILDENGQSYRGNPKDVESYYCYDQAILSPADGEVVEVVAHEDETNLPSQNI
ncbi:hypothetical protein [Anoxynatronum buryatiense]|uniref:Uncharacterized protein n=1 Tax=Anoxynatronum buryatiense TaxID=489973 RepID=A0AA45WYV6_9CLOT|nr:hypothetical protein [Anoxynatronum buryatiense]SMP68610.1 hypothetical protein SAMN06296020_11730 [Anoxynatronum buryatiense]